MVADTLQRMAERIEQKYSTTTEDKTKVDYITIIYNLLQVPLTFAHKTIIFRGENPYN